MPLWAQFLIGAGGLGGLGGLVKIIVDAIRERPKDAASVRQLNATTDAADDDHAVARMQSVLDRIDADNARLREDVDALRSEVVSLRSEVVTLREREGRLTWWARRVWDILHPDQRGQVGPPPGHEERK